MHPVFNLKGIYTLLKYTPSESIHITPQSPPLTEHISFL